MRRSNRDDDWLAKADLIFIGYVCGLIVAAAIAITNGGCGGRRAPRPDLPVVLPVAITSWPSPIKPQCDVEDLPPVPDVFLWQRATEEEAGRIYITQRQLADLVVWMKDVQHWSGQATACIGKLTQ